MKWMVLLLLCFNLLGFQNGKAKDSIFDFAYLNWRETSSLKETDVKIPTFFSRSQHVINTENQKEYVIHQSISGEAYAVEWLFDNLNEKREIERSFEKQLAGMFLFALDNRLEELLWSIVNQESFYVQSAQLMWNREANRQFVGLWRSGNVHFHYTATEKSANLLFTVKNDTLLNVEIHPHLLNVIGNTNQYYAEFVHASLSHFIQPKLNQGYSKWTSAQLKPGRFNSENSSLADSGLKVNEWLSGTFTGSDFSSDFTGEIKTVMRDTLVWDFKEKPDQTLNQLLTILTAWGEKSEISIISAKKLESDLERFRFLFILKQGWLGYENVLRIDQEQKTDKSNTKITSLKILLMVLNPLSENQHIDTVTDKN